MLAALTATVGHRLVIFALRNILTATMGASGLASPTQRFKIRAGRLLIGELLKKLVEADCLGLVPCPLRYST